MEKTFAIIGTGNVFLRHIQAIQSVGGRILEATSNPIKWGEFIKNTEANYLVILTPNDLHYPMIMTGIANKKTILCEKPLTIKSEQTEYLSRYPNIFTVLQMRYHPAIRTLKEEIEKEKEYEIEIGILVYRFEEFFMSWKGNKKKSGGLLIGLGIHYFDLLQYLFGMPTNSIMEFYDEKKASGRIEGQNYICDWKIDTTRKSNRRYFIVNGIKYYIEPSQEFYNQTYQDLIDGKGITPKEAIKSLKMCEELYDNFARSKNR